MHRNGVLVLFSYLSRRQKVQQTQTSAPSTVLINSGFEDCHAFTKQRKKDANRPGQAPRLAHRSVLMSTATTGDGASGAAAGSSVSGGGGSDCDRPVCATKGEMFSMLKKVTSTRHGSSGTEAGGGNTEGGGSGDIARATSSGQSLGAAACPVDVEELGQGTWALVRSRSKPAPQAPKSSTP